MQLTLPVAQKSKHEHLLHILEAMLQQFLPKNTEAGISLLEHYQTTIGGVLPCSHWLEDLYCHHVKKGQYTVLDTKECTSGE